MWVARYSGQLKSDVPQPWKRFDLRPRPYRVASKPRSGNCTCNGGQLEVVTLRLGRRSFGQVAMCQTCGRERYLRRPEASGLPWQPAFVRAPAARPVGRSGNCAPWIYAGPDPRLGGPPVDAGFSARLAMYPHGGPAWAVVQLAKLINWPHAEKPRHAVSSRRAPSRITYGPASPGTLDNVLEQERTVNGHWGRPR